MNVVTFQSDSLRLTIIGHVYVASGCLFVWNDREIISVRVDTLFNGYYHPFDGLIFDMN